MNIMHFYCTKKRLYVLDCPVGGSIFSLSCRHVQVMVNSEKERVSLLFMKALVSTGSVDAVSQQMASHPQYLESFLRTQHYILHMDGPLPLPYRHYIAIMVSEQAAFVLLTSHVFILLLVWRLFMQIPSETTPLTAVLLVFCNIRIFSSDVLSRRRRFPRNRVS